MGIRSSLRALLTVTAVMWGAGSADAHFAWIESDVKDGQTHVRAGFGDAGGWDEDLVEKIAPTKYWARVEGKLEPLALPLDKEAKEYRGRVEGKVPSAIIGVCDYGVVQFGQSPASHLRYTAKNLVGAPTAWQDTVPNVDLRIEALAALDGDAVKLQVLFLGKPLQLAKIKGTGPSGEEVELKTDAEGVAHWPLAGGGMYRCYIGTTTKEAGELDGKKFESLKDYTTVTFTIPSVNPASKAAVNEQVK